MDQVFGTGNLVAMSGWASLLAALVVPAVRKPVFLLTGLLIPLGFALAYVALLLSAPAAKGAGVGSIVQVRTLFSVDGALTAGWFHYLAFDLFVGTWIARDGLERGAWRILIAPCLGLTFMFGPAGLLLYVLLRLAFLRRAAARPVAA